MFTSKHAFRGQMSPERKAQTWYLWGLGSISQVGKGKDGAGQLAHSFIVAVKERKFILFVLSFPFVPYCTPKPAPSCPGCMHWGCPESQHAARAEGRLTAVFQDRAASSPLGTRALIQRTINYAYSAGQDKTLFSTKPRGTGCELKGHSWFPGFLDYTV